MASIYVQTESNEKTFLQDLFSNSEAFASELLKNREYIFPLHYLHSDILNHLTTHWCVIRRERDN